MSSEVFSRWALLALVKCAIVAAIEKRDVEAVHRIGRAVKGWR